MKTYTVRDPSTLIQTNDEIRNLFDTKESFCVSRIGNMEGYFLDCIHNNTTPAEQFYSWLSLTSGVFPHDIEYLKNTWAPINFKAIENSDIVGFVDISGQIKQNKNFIETYCENKFTFYFDDILALDPGYLVNKNIVDVECADPWTKKLKNKRVLVISSFRDTILNQWDNIDKIWGSDLEKIAPFDLVDVIQAPFHPAMDDRQVPLECYSWDKLLEHLKQQIDNYEYDVLLVGAASLAPALAEHAKLRNKIGITICGAIQLFFGIIGSRWSIENPHYNKWSIMYNDNWVWPLESDLPKNRAVFNRFEKAYWK
jgi:hypothetical protein